LHVSDFDQAKLLSCT